MLEMLGDTFERLFVGVVILGAAYYWYIPVALMAISYVRYKLKGGK